MALRIAGQAPATPDRCGDTGAQAGAPVTSPVTKVRITLRSRAADGTTLHFCDRVFAPGSTPPFLSIDDQAATAIDVFAEAFAPGLASDPPSADGWHRVAVGALYGLPPNPQKLPPMRLYNTEQFACAGARLQQARAFHTATLLPDGRVLFVGGLVAAADDPTAFTLTSNGAYVLGTAEVFDPRTQTTTPVTETSMTAPAPRAFHAAQLLTSAGPCASGQLAILLVGGLTNSPGMGMAILQPAHGQQGGRLLPQTPDAALFTPMPTRAIGNEILCLDPNALSATRVPVSGKPSALRAAGAGPSGLVAAGGIDYDPTMLNQADPVVEVAAFSQSGAVEAAAVGIGRQGASLSVVDAKTAVVWGGGAFTDPIGELLTTLNTTPSSTPLTLTGTPITQFHTATLLPAATGSAVANILVTGGFEVTSGGTDTQPTAAITAVRMVNVDTNAMTATALPVGFGGTFVADSTCNNPARYRPAGWESATMLAHGGVLVTGGAPSTALTNDTPPRCPDCPGEASLLCAIGQASIYDPSTLTISPTGALSVPRFGHTTTTLLDGSILVAGGIGADVGTVDGGASITTSVFLSDLEIYDQRATLPPYDMTTRLDLDDPIYSDLVKAQPPLGREPAALATTVANPKVAVHECSTL